MIKVLIVDDSKVIQEFLAHLLSSDPDIQVVGFANSGYEAVELVRIKKPDVITMDIHMPGMDGYEATRTIMETVPTPIVIVSGSAKTKEIAEKFRSLEAGALAMVIRPPGFEDPQFAASRKEMIQTVKLMSEVKVVKLFPRSRKEQIKPPRLVQTFENDLKRIQVIAIGASTGGPMALQIILSRLPGDLPVPVLIVQHIAAGFVKGFKEWLSATSGIKLKIAEDGEHISAGIGYIAPDNFHMGLSRGSKINLSNQPPENGLKPSVSFLFRSIAQTIGPNALGVLLTGMGKDGADELKAMKDKGAFTIVQNQESSVVFGMPGEALRIGASDQALPPGKIAEILAKSGSKK
ncbi:MAG: chemotaxis-specific protein-glutamate methyltransferase CheB [Bacteroidales bacterium]|jgi:two-component system chemotaxis response regulator CheB